MSKPPQDQEEAKRARLKAAAGRARAEAKARREVAVDARRPKEVGGPEGPEPTRFGDWEKKGIASDF